MRYFDDGDLTEGLAIAPKPYPADLVLGYWHAVSTCFAGDRQTVDYDDPSSPALFRLQLEALDGRGSKGNGKVKGKNKQQHQDDATLDDLMVTLNYRDWHLEFTGIYNTSGPATNLYLSNNETPDVGDVDKEATLAFGTVLDDRGYPFLRIGLSACEAESGDDDMQSIEIIAKKTDTTEVHKLELSKNERLRLGYAVRSDGHFEDIVGMGEPTDSYESLTRQLSEYTAASARIAQQLTIVRARMDEQLREAAETGQQIRSIYDEHRLSLPSRATTSSARPPPQPTAAPPKAASSAPRPSTASRPPAANKSQTTSRRTFERVNGAAYATPTSVAKGKRHCQYCDKTVSLSHGAWDKHVNSKKHEELSKAPASAPSKTANERNNAPGTPRAGLSTRRTSGVGASSGSKAKDGSSNRQQRPPSATTQRTRNILALLEQDGDDDDSEDGGGSESQLSEPGYSEEGAENRRESVRNPLGQQSKPTAPSASVATTIAPGGATVRASPTTAGTAIFTVVRKRRRPTSAGGGKGPTQLCQACDCQISVKNWNVHTKSNKHRLNSGVLDAVENGAVAAAADAVEREEDEEDEDDLMDLNGTENNVNGAPTGEAGNGPFSSSDVDSNDGAEGGMGSSRPLNGDLEEDDDDGLINGVGRTVKRARLAA